MFERLEDIAAADSDIGNWTLSRWLSSRQFEVLVANCVVLPFDQDAAAIAADIWSASTRRQRSQLGDMLIAAVAVSRQIPLATRNKRDFQQFSKASGVSLRLVDWTRVTPRAARGTGERSV